MALPLLIDIDGVLSSGESMLNGVPEFFSFLRENQIKFCLLSNSTKFGKEDLVPFFERQGITVDFPILTALDATKEYLLANYQSAVVYAIPSAKEKLSVLPAENPEVVVVGDLGTGFTYEVLNEILRHLMNGSSFLAMHKNAIGKNENGHYLDAGSFVTALEYGSGTKAQLLGKPSSSYFNSALELIGSSIQDPFIMLGDDLKVDIGPALDLKGEAVLVLTGKTSSSMLENQKEIHPTFVADDLYQVISWLKEKNAN